MTTKRLVLVIASVLCAVVLLVLLFVGAISGIVFYSLNHSDATETARSYLRANERLKREIGEVRDFGWLVTGSINSRDADGDATLNLKVMGERAAGKARVGLVYGSGSRWRVTDAFYVDEKGKAVDLMNKYEEQPEPANGP